MVHPIGITEMTSMTMDHLEAKIELEIEDVDNDVLTVTMMKHMKRMMMRSMEK